uniref:Uncharacterized protein n=1 Tax=Zea mays TaxID=4577 RepID=A0A804N2X8_MAIZE
MARSPLCAHAVALISCSLAPTQVRMTARAPAPHPEAPCSAPETPPMDAPSRAAPMAPDPNAAPFPQRIFFPSAPSLLALCSTELLRVPSPACSPAPSCCSRPDFSSPLVLV